MKNPFFPDFLIIDEELGIYIDIEIDEPYSFDTGDLIHHNKSNDIKRDYFFTENCWIVIRFSENQILSQPYECVSLIENILEAIKNKENQIITYLIEEKKWTVEEAKAMKIKNSRLKGNS